jgi:hypothetical protein
MTPEGIRNGAKMSLKIDKKAIENRSWKKFEK